MSGIDRHRLVALLLVPVLGLGATSCTSSKKAPSNKAPSSPAQSSAAPTTLPTETPTLPAAAPGSAAALAAFMQAGLPATGFAHLDFQTGLAGTSLTGQGAAILSAGSVTGLDVHTVVTGVGAVHLVYTGGTGYAALPTPTAPGKPYALIGGSADSAQMSRTAIALEATELLAAPATYRTLVAASQGLTRLGDATVGETPVLHYRATAHVDKIPANDRVRVALTALGVTSLALQVWVDGRGRPLKVAAPSPDGRVSDVTFTEINQPVTVSAPPAAQVDK